MIRVRVFRAEKPAGVISLDGANQRIRPTGLLPDDEIDAIARDLNAGRITGLIGEHQWYRQATPFCPTDASKLCPCDSETCDVGVLP